MTPENIILDNEKSIKSLIDEQTRIAIEAIATNEELHKQLLDQETKIFDQRERIVELESKLRGKCISEGKLRKKVENLEQKLEEQKSYVLERPVEVPPSVTKPEKKLSCYLKLDPNYLRETLDLYDRLDRLLAENECYRDINANLEAQLKNHNFGDDELKKELEDRDNHIEYLMTSHAEEIKQYEDLLSESATSIQTYQETIKELNRKIQILEGKNQSKQIMYNSIKEKNGRSIIVEGIEEDLYPGEQKDILLQYIKDRMANLEPNSRQFHICKSLLEANPENGTREKLRRELYEALKKKCNICNPPSEVKEKFNSIGIEIRNSKSHSNPHPKLIFRNDDRYTVSISSTPSDKRSLLNTASDLVRTFL